MIQTSAKRQTTPQAVTVPRTILVDGDEVRIPGWVQDLDSFRRWFRSDDFPEAGRICYLDDEVWIDMSMEQAFTHNDVKTEMVTVIRTLVKAARLGRMLGDGMRITNVAANLSCVPDGVFVATKTLRSGKVRLQPGVEGGCLEFVGSPDMVLEVVSTSSVKKDTEELPELYWLAGITEYWLVDARGDHIQFDIFQHAPKGYTTVRKQAGWVKSAVFGKSFKLTRQKDELENPEYTLAVK